MNLLVPWRSSGVVRDEMTQLRRALDRVFDRWGLDLPLRTALAVSYPAMNVWQDDDGVYVEAELPGINLEALDITVVGEDQLTIKGSRAAADPSKVDWYRQERPFGSFERTVSLPANVDAKNVEAKLQDGVLSIRLPKSQDARATKIVVKAD